MRTASLRDLAADGHLIYSDGYRTKKAELAPDGYRIIRVADVGNDVVRLDSPDFVGGDRAPQIGVKASEPGDILLTTKGTVGRLAVMPEAPGRSVYSPQLCFFRIPEGSDLVTGYLKAWLRSPDFWRQAAHSMNNTDMAAYISLRDLGLMTLPVLSLPVQRGIAEVLGALDDKIAANDVLRRTAAQLATARYLVSLLPEMQSVAVADACTVLSRGASPRYTEDAAAMLVLNQKCIRGGKVDLAPARRTEPDRVRADTVLQVDDVLVNSTGMGTLGRVAAWDRAGVATVDSHITIARPDPRVVDPAVFGVALMEMQSEIEGLAEGSTGQTELSRQQLGALVVPLPARPWQGDLGSLVRSLSKRSLAAAEESRQLAALRDALLPELMSGRLRVKDAEKTVEEVV